MPSYLSLTDFKLFLRDSSTTYDSLYDLILSGVEQAVETYIGRGPLGRQAVTEYYSPSGERDLVLDRYPLLSPADVTAVYVDRNGNFGQTSGGFDGTATLQVAGVDYAVRIEGGSRRAVLTRVRDFWPFTMQQPAPNYLSTSRTEVPGSVKVTYTAGWTSAAPADVIAACYAEAAARWKLTPFGFGFPTSESVAGASASISLMPGQLRFGPFVTDVLFRAAGAYRRIPCGR